MGQFTPKSKDIFPLAYSAVYPSLLFWHVVQSLGDISRRDVCLFSNIIELDGTSPVVLKAPKIHTNNATSVSLYRNQDLVTQDNPPPCCKLFSCTFLLHYNLPEQP